MESRKVYNRRYIGNRESMSYVLFSSSKTFHIKEFETRFVIDVLKIDLGWNSIIAFTNGIWDIINDGLLGALIDKTHTRWGKFKPYLFTYASAGTIFTTLYWLTPLLFNRDPRNLGKAAFWLLLAMILESFTTVRDTAETGLISCVSPSPDDRVRMYTMAEVVGAIWQDIPGVVMGVLIDLVNHNRASFSMEKIYISMGTFTMVTAGVLAMFFCLYAKERVSQAAERHNYREGLRAILRNKPLLILLLTDFLGGFQVETWEHNYFIDVLGSESLRNVVRIPGVPLSFLSYAYINKARERYSVKSLWILGTHLKDILALAIFAIGSVGGIYHTVVPMVAMLMIRNLFYMGTLSINKIIPREIVLDAVEYAEWNTGFRSEGAILSARSMTMKITRNVINSMTTFIMKKTDYSLDAGFGQQSARAKYALFAMSYGLPALLGLLSIIPKLFYDLTGEKRARMYEELKEIRRLRQMDYDKLNQEESEATQ